MLSESLTNMNKRNPYDNNSKKEKKRPGKTPFQSKQAPDNSRESEKESPLHPFFNCDYVACRFLAGTDPITRRELEKTNKKNGLGKKKKSRDKKSQ